MCMPTEVHIRSFLSQAWGGKGMQKPRAEQMWKGVVINWWEAKEIGDNSYMSWQADEGQKRDGQAKNQKLEPNNLYTQS